MFPKPRTIALAGVVLFGALLVAGAGEAKAQFFVSTPGFSFGVGGYTPFGVYPGYGYAPFAPIVPVPVRPYPYVYPRAYYGPRPYYPHAYGYRRW
jgi:hypothetical protein